LLQPQVFVAEVVAEHSLKPQFPPQLPLQLPHPPEAPQVQLPPFTAPQLAKPQLLSAVHPLPRDEHGIVSLIALLVLNAFTANSPPTKNNPATIAIIHNFILTSYVNLIP
jgi:hypothetical protein